MSMKKLFTTEIAEATEIFGAATGRALAYRGRAIKPWFFSVLSGAKKGLFALLTYAVLVLNVAAEPLGRLFHTPEQRALLNTARKTMPMNAGGEAETPSAPDFALKGVVTRSDGKRSVWLNGRMEHGTTRPGAQERNQVQVQLPAGATELKVGQSIDPATGRVTESYRRPPPEPVAVKPAPTQQPNAKDAGKAPAPKSLDEDRDPDKPAP